MDAVKEPLSAFVASDVEHMSMRGHSDAITCGGLGGNCMSVTAGWNIVSGGADAVGSVNAAAGWNMVSAGAAAAGCARKAGPAVC